MWERFVALLSSRERTWSIFAALGKCVHMHKCFEKGVHLQTVNYYSIHLSSKQKIFTQGLSPDGTHPRVSVIIIPVSGPSSFSACVWS